jgi:hypothetical protein
VLVLTLALVPIVACERDTPIPKDRAFAEADRNVDRTREVAARARRYLELWLSRIDTEVGLFPRRDAEVEAPLWRPADNAADNYPYLVLTAAIFEEGLVSGQLEQLLWDETARTTRFDGLVDEYSIETRSFAFPDVDLHRILYNSAEYTKDGLVPVTDLLGTSPWSDRLVSLTDSIWRHANVSTRFGPVPTDSMEVHGELLQVACRLYWRTGDARYLDLATRIGDHYLFDRHPTRVPTSLVLDDHGNEIIAGLSELYLTVSHADPARHERYRRPLELLLDDIAEHGRDENGLLYLRIGTPAGDPASHDPALSDTWGYVFNAFFTAYLVDGTSRYREVVLEGLEGLQNLGDYEWEPRSPHDGLADAIEGAIMLHSHIAAPGVERWVAVQVGRMWEAEDQHLVAGTDYLHGNVTRTSLMYLLMLTQGVRARPWSPGVGLGAVTRDGSLFLTVESDRAWRGTLVFDGARHSTVWGLPQNYPRINAFPEWFVVDPDATYRLSYVETDAVEHRSGRELLAGIPVALDGGGRLHLEITQAPERVESPMGMAPRSGTGTRR